MDSILKRTLICTTILSAVFFMPSYATAATSEDYKSLKVEVQTLRAEMAEMRNLLKQQGVMISKKTTPKITQAEVYALKKEVKKISKVAKNAEEWRHTNANFLLTGSADVVYSNNKGDNGALDGLGFDPVFRYQYKDILYLESEVEFEVDSTGAAATNIEYMNLDLFLNDFATLVVGKFTSPVGQFRQNLHSAWINKLPSKPVGFMNKEAAPVADIGLGFRGGLPIANTGMEMNYAVYTANGPEITQTGGVLDGVDSDAPTPRDVDGNKIFGARLGFRPLPRLELGFSGATGKVAVVAAGARVTGEKDRDYNIIGGDFSYQFKNLTLRGEYVRQKIDALSTSAAPNAAEWSTYYLQTSYKLPHNLEGVIRYGNYAANKAVNDRRQFALGMNYLFAPQLIAKFDYEFNQGNSGSTNNNDSFIAQLAYGF